MPSPKPKSKKPLLFITCGGCLTILVLMFLYSVFSAKLMRTFRGEKPSSKPQVKIYDKETLATMPRPETGISYSFYPVYGTTMNEIDTSITTNMPAYGGDIYRAEGVAGAEAGRTESTFYWNVTPVQEEKECLMADIKLDTKLVLVMPEWKDRDTGSAFLAAEWDSFYNALDIHEVGHKNFELQQFDEMWEVFKNVPKFEQCEALVDYVKAEIEKVKARNIERNTNYDIQTQHGQNQGAYVPQQ